MKEGDPRASEQLLPPVYDELRRLARSYMGKEKEGQTIQATALAHEAYMPLPGGLNVSWDSRGHFFSAAAMAMRRTLVERARHRKRIKHGGEMQRVDADPAEVAAGHAKQPGIAQIFEAGAAPLVSLDGLKRESQPFIAMELVRGIALNTFCEQNGLDTRERLRLMTRVCEAVHHAHQRGVIHRDLKPGNILVEEGGAPKLLDFGVARAADIDMRVTTLQTSVGQLIGTLPYMSPEQVLGDPSEIDTRSDGYALGVVMYQLRTGRLPLDVASRSIPEAARVIREESPTKLGRVSRVFRGEIDTIVGRALDKDKRRRYQSAADLGDDIRRYLSGEPIRAKQDSALYVLRKQLKRYKWAAVAAAVALAALMAFTVYATLQARRERALAANQGMVLGVYDLHTGERRPAEFFQSTNNVPALAAVPGGEHLVSIGDTLGVLKGDRLVPLPTVGAQSQIITALGSHDGAAVIVSRGGTVRRAGLDTRDASPRVQGFASWCFDARFSPDGTLVAIVGGTPEVRVLDARSQDVVRVFELPVARMRARVARFLKDSRTLLIGCGDGAVRLYDAPTGGLLEELRASPYEVYPMELSPDQRTLAVGHADGAIRMWNLEDCTSEVLRPRMPRRVQGIAFSPDGERLLVTTYDGVVDAFDATYAFLTRLRAHQRLIPEPAFSRDGSLFASGSQDSTVRLWDAKTLRTLAPLETSGAEVVGPCFSPDNLRLAATNASRVTTLYDFERLDDLIRANEAFQRPRVTGDAAAGLGR